MKSLLEDKERARIVVIEGNMSVRFMLVDILRGFGYQNIQPVDDGAQALQQLKSDEVDWIIGPLNKEDTQNIFHLLPYITSHPRSRRTNVSLLLASAEESYCLGKAFELGLMSYHIRSYVKEELESELQRLLDTMLLHSWQPALTAASYLRSYLTERNQHEARLAMERSLLPLFPGNGQLLGYLAEAEAMVGRQELALSLWKRAELIQQGPLDPALVQRLQKACPVHSEAPQPENVLGLQSVIVIEPDSASRLQVTKSLEDLGVNDIHDFASADDALIWLTANPAPDFVIMEWRVPGVSGPMLIQRIRSTLSADIPVLVLSSRVREGDLPLLQEMGVNRIQEKPCDKEALYRAIIWTIQQQRAPSEQKTMETKIRALLQESQGEQAEELIAAFRLDGRISQAAKIAIEAEYEYFRGNFAVAIQKSIAAVQQGADSLALMNLIGKSMLKLEKYDSALHCFEKAQEMSPMNIERLLDIADSQIGIGDDDAARETADAILRIDPGHQVVAEVECKIALNKGDQDAAAAAVASLDSLPRIAAYINNRAVAMALAGKSKECIDLYQKAIQVLPDHWKDVRATVVYNLALAHARNNDMSAALATIEPIRQDPLLTIYRKARASAHRLEECVSSGRPLFKADELKKGRDRPPLQWDQIAGNLEIKRGEVGCYLLFYCNEEADERLFKMVS